MCIKPVQCVFIGHIVCKKRRIRYMPYISPPYDELYRENNKPEPSHVNSLYSVSIIHAAAAVVKFSVGVYDASVTALKVPLHAARINYHLLFTEVTRTYTSFKTGNNKFGAAEKLGRYEL